MKLYEEDLVDTARLRGPGKRQLTCQWLCKDIDASTRVCIETDFHKRLASSMHGFKVIAMVNDAAGEQVCFFPGKPRKQPHEQGVWKIGRETLQALLLCVENVTYALGSRPFKSRPLCGT